MKQELTYLGITHHAAPMCVREAFHSDGPAAREMYARLAVHASGRLILATCERFELYVLNDRPALQTLISHISDWFHLPECLVRKYASIRTGDEAARHLLHVAAGMDSRIVGEPHILGQVRLAYAEALDAGALNHELAALGRAALRAGKRVRAETDINAGRQSIVTLALRRLEDRMPGHMGLRVLVLGSGTIAADVLARLPRHRLVSQRVCVAGRSEHRTRALAVRSGAAAIAWNDVPRALADMDAVIACTSSRTFVVDSSMVAATLGVRQKGRLLLFDLGMPRNIDPASSRLPNVELFDLNELAAAATPSRENLSCAIKIVDQEFERFRRWRNERAVAPIIAAMIRRARNHQEFIPLSKRRILHRRITRLKAEASA